MILKKSNFINLWRQSRIGNQKWNNSNLYDECFEQLVRFCKRERYQHARTEKISMLILIELLNLPDISGIKGFNQWVCITATKKNGIRVGFPM